MCALKQTRNPWLFKETLKVSTYQQKYHQSPDLSLYFWGCGKKCPIISSLDSKLEALTSWNSPYLGTFVVKMLVAWGKGHVFMSFYFPFPSFTISDKVCLNNMVNSPFFFSTCFVVYYTSEGTTALPTFSSFFLLMCKWSWSWKG